MLCSPLPCITRHAAGPQQPRAAATLLLAASALLLSHALELMPLPAMQPYPPLRPFDSGYPANIPTDLPAELPPPPSPLSPGPTPAGACDTTVGAVLARHNRNGLATFLAQSALGRQVLSGTMAATVLAPPDGALTAALPAGAGAAAAAGLASYHVLQGSLSLAQLSVASGRWRNTSLAAAYCPTALQTATLLSGSPDALSDPITFVRSADTTARIVSGDHAACNSVVHLLDGALQPCCSSLFSQAQLGQFSIVQIQPSYFDGFNAQPPPDNSDASNRRLFEEALVDLLLVRAAAAVRFCGVCGVLCRTCMPRAACACRCMHSANAMLPDACDHSFRRLSTRAAPFCGPLWPHGAASAWRSCCRAQSSAARRRARRRCASWRCTQSATR